MLPSLAYNLIVTHIVIDLMHMSSVAPRNVRSQNYLFDEINFLKYIRRFLF